MTTVNVGVQYEFLDSDTETSTTLYRAGSAVPEGVEAKSIQRVPVWIRTKKLLKAVALISPERLLFINTSPFTQGTPQRFHLSDIVGLDHEIDLIVVGPNPWLSPKWDATVHVNAGRLIVQ